MMLSETRAAAPEQGSRPHPTTWALPKLLGGGAGAEPRTSTLPALKLEQMPTLGFMPGPRERELGHSDVTERQSVHVCLCAHVCVCGGVDPSCPCPPRQSPPARVLARPDFKTGDGKGGKEAPAAMLKRAAAQAPGQAYCQTHILRCDIL
uniref:Uncharacterized protein n=1 Tax=Molossus molossus TaxID=27622 RepID=A0A7J8HC67_MOLMO|nr:hypothetical protein HJG59_011222 [Molossus molossus]